MPIGEEQQQGQSRPKTKKPLQPWQRVAIAAAASLAVLLVANVFALFLGPAAFLVGFGVIAGGLIWNNRQAKSQHSDQKENTLLEEIRDLLRTQQQPQQQQQQQQQQPQQYQQQQPQQQPQQYQQQQQGQQQYQQEPQQYQQQQPQQQQQQGQQRQQGQEPQQVPQPSQQQQPFQEAGSQQPQRSFPGPWQRPPMAGGVEESSGTQRAFSNFESFLQAQQAASNRMLEAQREAFQQQMAQMQEQMAEMQAQMQQQGAQMQQPGVPVAPGTNLGQEDVQPQTEPSNVFAKTNEEEAAQIERAMAASLEDSKEVVSQGVGDGVENVAGVTPSSERGIDIPDTVITVPSPETDRASLGNSLDGNDNAITDAKGKESEVKAKEEVVDAISETTSIAPDDPVLVQPLEDQNTNSATTSTNLGTEETDKDLSVDSDATVTPAAEPDVVVTPEESGTVQETTVQKKEVNLGKTNGWAEQMTVGTKNRVKVVGENISARIDGVKERRQEVNDNMGTKKDRIDARRAELKIARTNKKIENNLGKEGAKELVKPTELPGLKGGFLGNAFQRATAGLKVRAELRAENVASRKKVNTETKGTLKENVNASAENAKNRKGDIKMARAEKLQSLATSQVAKAKAARESLDTRVKKAQESKQARKTAKETKVNTGRAIRA